MCVVQLLLFFVLLSACDCALPYGYHENVGIKQAAYLLQNERMGRIIGGSEVSSITAYPYQAGIIATLKTGWTSICGGSLVSNTRVLTAAHCWWDGQNQATSFTVVLGSLRIFSGGTRLNSSDVVVHPSWNVNDITHDIAMVRIASVQFNNNIQAVSLPAMSDVNNAFAGVTAAATGYGKTTDANAVTERQLSDFECSQRCYLDNNNAYGVAQTNFPQTTTLHHVNLKVLTNTVCQKSFSDVAIHGSHLCTDGASRVGTCEGDSGGPLTTVLNHKRILIGIVSFGLGDSCQRGTPSVYTRVTSFLTWLNAQL